MMELLSSLSFGRDGGCQKILYDVKGYEKISSAPTLPPTHLPPPSVYVMNAALLQIFFHAILVISFFKV